MSWKKESGDLSDFSRIKIGQKRIFGVVIHPIVYVVACYDTHNKYMQKINSIKKHHKKAILDEANTIAINACEEHPANKEKEKNEIPEVGSNPVTEFCCPGNSTSNKDIDSNYEEDFI